MHAPDLRSCHTPILYSPPRLQPLITRMTGSAFIMLPGLFRFENGGRYSRIVWVIGMQFTLSSVCNSRYPLIKCNFVTTRYFESQLQLFVELEYYLTLHHNCSEEYFPEPADVLSNGHQRLYDLIRIHGGKTMLAQKLDMKYAWEAGSGAVVYTTHYNQSSVFAHQGAPIPKSNRSWGPFSLNFAVKLLQFVRSQYLLLNPPLSCAHISMPCESDLIRGGYDELASQVIWFGGYENVARKLGLQFFDEKSQWLDERTFRVAKMLWKNRMNENFTTYDGSAKNSALGKTKGVPWNEDIVVKEL